MNINETIKICGSCSNCPTITKIEKGYIIRDDYSGVVRLTTEESKILIDLLKHEQGE